MISHRLLQGSARSFLRLRDGARPAVFAPSASYAGFPAMGGRGSSPDDRQAVYACPRRAFSSDKRLSTIINSELQHDLKTGSAEKPTELLELEALVGERLVISDVPGDAVVRLTSFPDDLLQVDIEFDSRDGVEDEEMYDDGQGGGEEEGGDLTVPFTATIVKGDVELRFSCTASENVDINAVELVQPDEDYYSGPGFDELDDELQEAFHEYLEEAGVTADVAAFISMYSEYKEQQEYASWLAKVDAFVKT